MIGLYLPSAPSLLICFDLSFHILDVVKMNFVMSDIFVSNIINTVATTALVIRCSVSVVDCIFFCVLVSHVAAVELIVVNISCKVRCVTSLAASGCAMMHDVAN